MRAPWQHAALGVLATVLLTTQASAQSQCTGSVITLATGCFVRVELPTVKVAQLRLSATSTAFGTIALATLNAGQLDVTGPTFTVKANQAFQVQIHSASATFTGGSGAKPRADLHWKLASSGGGYTAMSGTAATVYTSATGAAISDGILYRMLLSFLLDTPGTYSLPVTITLSAP